jgi:hypothetical protein
MARCTPAEACVPSVASAVCRYHSGKFGVHVRCRRARQRKLASCFGMPIHHVFYFPSSMRIARIFPLQVAALPTARRLLSVLRPLVARSPQLTAALLTSAADLATTVAAVVPLVPTPPPPSLEPTPIAPQRPTTAHKPHPPFTTTKSSLAAAVATAPPAETGPHPHSTAHAVTLPETGPCLHAAPNVARGSPVTGASAVTVHEEQHGVPQAACLPTC